jgi:O-acetyl-ADP-ribose deacetylase (regulator of RNase III)
MVTVVKGNLLNASEKIIAHQVNCQKKMNSGVAKAIREKWSDVFEKYQQTEPQLGFVDFILVDRNYRYVANMYSQDNYGYDGQQYTNYDAFRQCCKTIVETCRNMPKKCSVAMPYKIASDRGGADWDKIMDILLEEFTDIDLTLYKL